MPPLNTFPLPLTSGAPPDGYGWPEHDSVSSASRTSAFESGINQRDRFLGKRRCLVCGISDHFYLAHCLIVKEFSTWEDLKFRGWIPEYAKYQPQHEPRNALQLCLNHEAAFNCHDCFIHFFPDIQKFVFINYCSSISLQESHGKAIPLDIRDHHAPFPSLLISMRCLVSEQKLQLQQSQGATSGGDTSSKSGTYKLELNDEVIAEILAVSRTLPSWKACQIEGTSWTGTAEENTDKYLSIVQPP
ncbi:hypothetical protein BJV77DRAFT_1126134 [Russula vinacea]|nr:hypothetical protein BJV77DRAFT_1126134 [Russula vinacea]